MVQRCKFSIELKNFPPDLSGEPNKMAELVFQNRNGNDVTTSLIVAQVFGKEHKNVVRDIENLSCSETFNQLNFERITYKDARNREQTAYEMTKDGFSFLVMGYTGAKAGEFKEKFISEFNKRESLLKNDDYILMRSQQILQKRIEIAEEKIKRLEQQNSKLQPKAFFADCIMQSEDCISIGEMANILKQNGLFGKGQNSFFEWLRWSGYLLNRGSRYNLPSQRSMRLGIMRIAEQQRGSVFINRKAVITPYGQRYFIELFGKSSTAGQCTINFIYK